MDLILLLGKILGHWNQRLQAHDSNRILLILGKLSKNWENFLKDVLFVQLNRKFTKSFSACSSNHGGVLITELNEFLSELLLLWA